VSYQQKPGPTFLHKVFNIPLGGTLNPYRHMPAPRPQTQAHVIFGGTGERAEETITGRDTVHGDKASSARAFGDQLSSAKTLFIPGPGASEEIEAYHRQIENPSFVDPEDHQQMMNSAMLQMASELMTGKSRAQMQRDTARVNQFLAENPTDKVVGSSFSRGSEGFQHFSENTKFKIHHYNEFDPVMATPLPFMGISSQASNPFGYMLQKNIKYPTNVENVSQVRSRDEQRMFFKPGSRQATDPTLTKVHTTTKPGVHGDIGGVEDDVAKRNRVLMTAIVDAQKAGIQFKPAPGANAQLKKVAKKKPPS
jgi:hypothetical protein